MTLVNPENEFCPISWRPLEHSIKLYIFGSLLVNIFAMDVNSLLHKFNCCKFTKLTNVFTSMSAIMLKLKFIVINPVELANIIELNESRLFELKSSVLSVCNVLNMQAHATPPSCLLCKIVCGTFRLFPLTFISSMFCRSTNASASINASLSLLKLSWVRFFKPARVVLFMERILFSLRLSVFKLDRLAKELSSIELIWLPWRLSSLRFVRPLKSFAPILLSLLLVSSSVCRFVKFANVFGAIDSIWSPSSTSVDTLGIYWNRLASSVLILLAVKFTLFKLTNWPKAAGSIQSKPVVFIFKVVVELLKPMLSR